MVVFTGKAAGEQGFRVLALSKGLSSGGEGGPANQAATADAFDAGGFRQRNGFTI